MEHAHRVEHDELSDRGLMLHVARHLHRLEELIMTLQDDLNAAVATIGAALDSISSNIATIQTETSELTAADAAILAEIQRLNDQIAAGQTVDLTALNDLVTRASGLATSVADATTGLQSAADAVEGIVPPPVA